jgi:hypothetical protein
MSLHFVNGSRIEPLIKFGHAPIFITFKHLGQFKELHCSDLVSSLRLTEDDVSAILKHPLWFGICSRLAICDTLIAENNVKQALLTWNETVAQGLKDICQRLKIEYTEW